MNPRLAHQLLRAVTTVVLIAGVTPPALGQNCHVAVSPAPPLAIAADAPATLAWPLLLLLLLLFTFIICLVVILVAGLWSPRRSPIEDLFWAARADGEWPSSTEILETFADATEGRSAAELERFARRTRAFARRLSDMRRRFE